MKTIISSTIDPELAKKIIQEEEENFLIGTVLQK